VRDVRLVMILLASVLLLSGCRGDKDPASYITHLSGTVVTIAPTTSPAHAKIAPTQP